MQQLALIQSGCQQWIRQPAAIHGSQFAFSSSLAVYIHASEDYRLLKVLAQATRHINALCWSPVDANLLAVSLAEKAVKVYQLDSEAATCSSMFHFADHPSILRWATHDESILLAAAGRHLAAWPYRATSAWHSLHCFKAQVTCMQQSATEPRLLAVGCSDGTLHLFDMLVQKVVYSHKLEEGAVPCDLQWDPLSKSYLVLLCANGTGGLFSVSEDLAALTQVLSMAKQPAGQRCTAFVPNAPGNYAVISGKSGNLQVFNVSQQQPLHSFKTGQGAAQSLNFFPGASRALITCQDGTVLVYDVATETRLWSSQPGHTETIFDCCFAPAGGNPHLLATCSYDGTVRVWDVTTQCCVKTLETRVQGREPADTHTTEKGVPANALYSVTWSPDGSQLAASSAGGAVYVFDYAKGIAVRKVQLHTRPSLRVTWHPTQPSLLASSSLDGTVVAFQADGSQVKLLTHTSPTSGCAWANQGYQLATTSDSGAVHVWDLNLPGDDCLLHTLTGHARRSFSAIFSPLVPELLLSGSDDATARVWDVPSGSCMALLSGHMTEVRALCWHPELPWLVLTGSWDSTIRCWDWRRQCCVYACSQHHADVYGLAIHSSCPWLLASTSRDSTLRLWDLRGLAAGLMTKCFLAGQVPRGQAAEARQHQDPLLCGTLSQQLADWCIQQGPPADDNGGSPDLLQHLITGGPGCIELFRKLSAFFTPSGHADELWQQAAVVAVHLADPAQQQAAAGRLVAPASSCSTPDSLQVQLLTRSCSGSGAGGSTGATAMTRAGSVRGGGGGASCSSGASTGGSSCSGPGCMCHLHRVKAALVSAANQLELGTRARGCARGCAGARALSGAGSDRRAEVLQSAAALHLQAGDVERYCELMVEANAWDKAIALAPAVSHSYWRQLLQRQADASAKAGTPLVERLPLLLAAGQTVGLVEQLMQQQQLDLAMKVAAVAASGGYQHLSSFCPDDQREARMSQTLLHPLCSHSSNLADPGGAAQSSSMCLGLPASPAPPAPATAGVGIVRSHSSSLPIALAAANIPAPAGATSSHDLSPCRTLLPKRNSLPPLRGLSPSTSGLSAASAGGAALGGSFGGGHLSSSFGGGGGSEAGNRAGSPLSTPAGSLSINSPGRLSPAASSPKSALLPLHHLGSCATTPPGLPGAAAAAATAAAAGATADSSRDPAVLRSNSIGGGGSSMAGDRQGLEGVSLGPQPSRLQRHPSGSMTQAHSSTAPSPVRHTHGGYAGAGTDAAAAAVGEAGCVAWAQLAAVCGARVKLHRSHGEPVRAAHAALMAHDVLGAVTALHLGNEPEQAAMVCLALGRLGRGVDSWQVDRVFDALTRKCEAAGDWQAAALALSRIHTDVQQQWELLAVRAELRATNSAAGSGSQGIGAALEASTETLAGSEAGVGAGGAGTADNVDPTGLRQLLKLLDARHCAAMASMAADSMDSVRYLLLAHEHGHAAAKAVTAMQPLLQALLKHLLLPEASTSGSATAGTSAQAAAGPTSACAGMQLLTSPAVVQLLRWQTYLESLSVAMLPQACWHDCFALILLASALRAFIHDYHQVGSYLFTRLRKWCEEHTAHFTLGRPVLLLLEAVLVQHRQPKAARSLLTTAAASDCEGGIRTAVRQQLQALSATPVHPIPRCSSSSSSECSKVVSPSSSLPHRPPSIIERRSVISAQLLQCGPWVLLDDGCSLVSLNEAVMLSHVMRFGPYGTGMTVQLVL